MTYSIVARDPATGYFGVAVASRFFAVGSLVPHIRGRLGAIATQAFISPVYGVEGLELLAQGEAPEDIVRLLTERDEGREHRQFHLIDAQGRNAAFTGGRCVGWAGHLLGDNVSVAGNMLEGPQVVAAALRAYQDSGELSLPERLMTALEAAEAVGGDKRGRQSAALTVYRDQAYAWLDLRSDDHAEPLAELRRLYAVAQERYLHYAEMMPTRENVHGVTDRTDFDRKMAELEAARAAAGAESASFAVGKPVPPPPLADDAEG
jgi:uncharacterized Ntn-hydrolase superfamily protein